MRASDGIEQEGERQQARKTGPHAARGGGSLGVFDLVALGPTGARLIQVKSNEKPRAAERERLELFTCPPYASKELWIFYDRQRAPLVEVL